MTQFTKHLHDITYIIIYDIYNFIITNTFLHFVLKKCMLSSKCNKKQICITNQKYKITTEEQHKQNTIHNSNTSPHPMVGIFDCPLEKFGGPEKGRFVVIGADHNSDSSEDLCLTPPFFIFIYFLLFVYFLFFYYYYFFCYAAPTLLPHPPSFLATPTTIFAPTVSPTCTRTVLSLVCLPLPLPFELPGVFLPLVHGSETPVCSVEGTGRTPKNFGVESVPTIRLLLLTTPFGGRSATGIVTGPWNSPFP